MRFFGRKAIVTLSMALGLSFFAPGVAQADVNPGTDNNVTTNEVKDALQKSGLADDSAGVNSKTDSDSVAITKVDGNTTDIPKDADAGIDLKSPDGQTLSITIPDAQSSDSGKLVSPGLVAYSNDNGSATAVQALDDGSTRFLTTIANRKAPIKYTYDVSVPEGGQIQITGDGGAVILDKDDKPISFIQKPWAKDANGNSVKTRFTTNGKSLTQVVNHRKRGIAYPVTADPWFSTNWSGITIHLNREETQLLALGAFGALGARLGGGWGGGIGAAGGQWLANRAVQYRMCVAAWKSWYNPLLMNIYLERC